MLMRPKKTLWQRLKEVVPNSLFAGGVVGLISGGIAATVTFLFTGIPWLSLPPFLGLSSVGTASTNMLGVLVVAVVANAVHWIIPALIAGALIGALAGVGYALYKRFSSSAKEAKANEVTPLLKSDPLPLAPKVDLGINKVLISAPAPIHDEVSPSQPAVTISPPTSPRS